VSVGALLVTAAAGPLGYPLWLLVSTRGRDGRLPPVVDDWPLVTAVVPAYREQAVIADKVADLCANGYPGPLQVVVVADDPATAAAARAASCQVVEAGRRAGKPVAINRGAAMAAGEVIVLSDANTRLAPGSLAAMVRWFQDPAVGAVAAEKRVLGGGESAYWRFESWLKRREDRLGGTVGLVGELAAVRRSAFRPVPADVTVDDLWIALDVLEAGHQIRYEPAAVSMEAPVDTLHEDWERRTRVVAGAFDALWRRRNLLAGHGALSVQLWGHRLVRQSLGPLAHAVLVGSAAVATARGGPGRPWAAAFLAAHVPGLVGLARRARGHSLSGVEAAGAHVLFLQAVALGGQWRYLRGERPVLWRKPERRNGCP